MQSYERMIEKLRSLNIYSLNGSSYIEKEFNVFALIIDDIDTKLNEILSSYFLENIDFDFFEKLRVLYLVSANVTDSNLINAIKKRSLVTNHDFNKDGIIKCIAGIGIDVSITENLDTSSVSIKILKDNRLLGSKEEKEAFIKECLPCHVTAIFV